MKRSLHTDPGILICCYEWASGAENTLRIKTNNKINKLWKIFFRLNYPTLVSKPHALLISTWLLLNITILYQYA